MSCHVIEPPSKPTGDCTKSLKTLVDWPKSWITLVDWPKSWIT